MRERRMSASATENGLFVRLLLSPRNDRPAGIPVQQVHEYNEEDKKVDFSYNPFSMPQGGSRRCSS
jgi:hypothetical protein